LALHPFAYAVVPRSDGDPAQLYIRHRLRVVPGDDCFHIRLKGRILVKGSGRRVDRGVLHRNFHIHIVVFEAVDSYSFRIPPFRRAEVTCVCSSMISLDSGTKNPPLMTVTPPSAETRLCRRLPSNRRLLSPY
jgi:hypothetical protein